MPRDYTDSVEQITLGDSVTVTISHTHNPELLSSAAEERWNQIDTILSSTPLLLQNGALVEAIKERTPEFNTKRHPRSAVGLLENGMWVFVLVDGRQKHSHGFTIIELAHFMLELGCTDALNLDGGGSSTMVINDTIVNSPSGREYGCTKNERPVSNALLLSAKT